LLQAFGYCFFGKNRETIAPDDKHYGNSMFCLSARTGLDLVLQSLKLDSGSEIIVSNVNIPDMFQILRHHQLEIIPISIQRDTLAISIDELKSSITLRSKAILVTHLFGSIANMEPIIEIAKQHQLIVIEDCAQAFDYNYCGHPKTDVALFSFGLIKTTTCLTGGMLCFNNKSLFEQVKELNNQLPVQQTKKYIAKVGKGIAIKVVTISWIYTILYLITQLFNKDFDEFLSGITKGFPGDDVMQKIRFQPCNANLRLLEYRINKIGAKKISARKELAIRILDLIPDHYKIGELAYKNSYWVLPIKTQNPEGLTSALRKVGIDATSKASSLISLPLKNTHQNDLSLDYLVYIPIHKKLINSIKM